MDLGDLLIHEGAAAQAQRHAARVFGADRTYFVLNGTSTSNKIVANAVLRRGDLVLFDRSAGRVERLTQFPREAMVVGA